VALDSSQFAGGQLLGANLLQQSLDKLTTAIEKQTSMLQSMRSGGSGGGSAAMGGSLGGLKNSYATFPKMTNPFNMSQQGTMQSVASRAMSFPKMGQTTPVGMSQAYGMVSPYQTFPTRGPTQGGPGAPIQNPGGSGFNKVVIGGSLGAIGASIASFGKSQFSNQVGMNAYAQQASLMAPNNMTFGQINAQLYGQAFGGNGRTPWAIGNGAMDQAQGQLVLNAAAGTYNPSSTGLGRSVMGATSAFGYVNPTLGLTGAAQMGAQVYSPQTSMAMRALGFKTTPRTIGKPGSAGFGTVVQSLFQRMYGAKQVSQKQLSANLSPTQTGGIDLSTLFGAQGGATMASTMEAFNKLTSGAGGQKSLSYNQANTLLSNASANKGGAQNTLQKYGIQKSDLQAIKDNQAQKTARASDYSSSYNSALQTATGLLTQFNKVLSQILKSSGASGVLGYAGGIGGTMSSLTHAGTMGLGLAGGLNLGRSILGGMAGRGAMKGGAGILGRIFGGGGGAAAAGGGEAAGAGGALGLSATGVGLAAAIPMGLSQIHHSNGASWLAQGPGGPKSGWNNWGQLGKNITSLFGGAAQPQTAQKTSSSGSSVNTPSGPGVNAVHTAERYLGTPYVYGGNSPATGFDCSGLVQYAYGQAGVKLPRTSQAQWAYLRRKAVSMKNVREGDIVFAAGSGGTPNNPDHEGMMISNNKVIQAPHTGANVDIINFDPNYWSHAARPSGSLAGGATAGGGGTGAAGSTQSVGASSMGGTGNAGLGISEASAISAGASESLGMSGGGIGGIRGSSGAAAATAGSSGAGTTASTGKAGGTTANLSGNKKIMNQAASKFGWGTGAEWSALNTLEMHEAGYNNTAQNPTSTAYGMGQFLNSTWAPYGPKTSNAGLQAKYMMEYIKGRYKDPIRAWGQYYSHPGGVGWYDKGTANAYKGVALVGGQGPELMSLKGGEQILNAGQTAKALSGGGAPININIAKGAIVVNGANTGSDAASSGREIAKQLLGHLNAENIYGAIGMGQKN
jgi:cell wall-associated NlpC family hydrolase